MAKEPPPSQPFSQPLSQPLSLPLSSAQLDARRKRALYRAGHRGTKELDLLLGQFANAMLYGYADKPTDQFSDDQRLAVVEWLVAQADYDLQPWLTDAGSIPPNVPTLVTVALQAFEFRV